MSKEMKPPYSLSDFYIFIESFFSINAIQIIFWKNFISHAPSAIVPVINSACYFTVSGTTNSESTRKSKMQSYFEGDIAHVHSPVPFLVVQQLT